MTSRRAQRRRCREVVEVSFLAAWCAGEEDLVEANKATHDGLIRILGDRRRGGVTWHLYDGAEALGVLERFLDGLLTEELSNYYRRIRGLLRENGGLLVVASAPAVRP